MTKWQLLVGVNILLLFAIINIINLKLGGTLGLFTGISILSLMELVFWIIRYFARKVPPLAAKENRL